VAILPQTLRSLAPEQLRDDVRLRALGVGLGLIPPRTMHSEEDARVLLDAARGARCVVEIGVYEGASALTLQRTLDADAELHLVDPFGRHPDALPNGWGATEWATRRVLARAGRHRGAGSPTLCWHPALSSEVAAAWSQLDWLAWSPFVAIGGYVVFHDARADREGGRGLPGPTAVVARHLRDGPSVGWAIVAETDRTVAARRSS
jgi:hypothetical protein